MHMGKHVAERVAFQSVRDRTRQQLGSVADDLDLPHVFDFLINAGVGKNSYATNLLDFAQTSVYSKNGNCVSAHSRLSIRFASRLLGRRSQSYRGRIGTNLHIIIARAQNINGQTFHGRVCAKWRNCCGSSMALVRRGCSRWSRSCGTRLWPTSIA